MSGAVCVLAILLCGALGAAAQDDPTALLSRALSLARQGRPEHARVLLERGRAAFPADKRFLLELAGLEYLRKDLPSAAFHLRAALRLDPSDAYANEFLASIDLMQGNLEAALVHWNRLNQPVLGKVLVIPEPALSPVLRHRLIAISAGQILTLDRLRTTAANLDSLELFSAYRFELSPSGKDRFSLTLRLADTVNPWRGWTARLLSLAGALPYRTLALGRRNIGRRAINFSTLWRWDPNKYRAAISLAGPWRQDPRYRYSLLLDARDERWNLTRTYRKPGAPLYDVRLRRIEAGADLAIALSARLQWTAGVRVSRAFYARGDGASLFADYWSVRARNQLAYELWRSPDRRIRVDSRAWFETGSILRQTRSRFAAGAGELTALWAPFWRDPKGIVRATASAGHIFGATPLDQLFMLGMERDNDLWLRGHVGTLDGRKGNAPMGRAYALGRIEWDRSWLRLPLVDFSAGPFFDTGGVGDSSTSLGSQGWMRDAGIQMTVAAVGKLHWTLVYGRDMRDGRGVFYTALQRVTPRAPPR